MVGKEREREQIGAHTYTQTHRRRKKRGIEKARERKDEDVGSDALTQPLEGRAMERWRGFRRGYFKPATGSSGLLLLCVCW